MLERDRELERIDDALLAAREGTGALLIIEGAAGIGKTALTLAAQRRAREMKIEVAAARGSELERELAFGVVRQLLEPHVAGADQSERSELFWGAAALAEPLFSPVPAPAGTSEADQTLTVLHGLYWLCANLAQRSPLLLSVDDAHWSDLASLRFIAYLGARLEGMPVTLAVAARPAETAADAELLGRLTRDPLATAIAPQPLSVEGVAALIAAEGDREPEPAFADACLRATGGVPLLVRELSRELRDQGVEPTTASASLVEQIGPQTVAHYVVGRVRRLSPEAETIARVVAVLGADADVRRVIRLAGIDDEAGALASLDGLALAGVLSYARPIEFTHPVVRAAIYGEIGPESEARYTRERPRFSPTSGPRRNGLRATCSPPRLPATSAWSTCSAAPHEPHTPVAHQPQPLRTSRGRSPSRPIPPGVGRRWASWASQSFTRDGPSGQASTCARPTGWPSRAANERGLRRSSVDPCDCCGVIRKPPTSSDWRSKSLRRRRISRSPCERSSSWLSAWNRPRIATLAGYRNALPRCPRAGRRGLRSILLR